MLGESTANEWQVKSAIRAGNTRTDSAHNRDNIDPLELIQIQRQARIRTLDIAGFYLAPRSSGSVVYNRLCRCTLTRLLQIDRELVGR